MGGVEQQGRKLQYDPVHRPFALAREPAGSWLRRPEMVVQFAGRGEGELIRHQELAQSTDASSRVLGMTGVENTRLAN